ncbi:cobalt transporter CbiM [Halanaerobaculum tunisiense]
MHISEGVLSVPILTTGLGLAGVGVTIGLRQMEEEDIPQVAIVAAALFIASLIRIPFGPTSLHLLLNGLAGILLSWRVFPATLVALLLQSILFQFGGLTTLGVNVINLALPAIICYYLYKGLFKLSDSKFWLGVTSFLCGSLGVLLATVMMALTLVLNGQEFFTIANMIVVGQLPLLLVEGIITSFCMSFIKQVKPELLELDISTS